MSTLLKNILIALAITLLLVLVYMLFLNNDETEGDTFNVRATSRATLESEKVLRDTAKIDALNIRAHSEILTSPEFVSLIDTHIPLNEVGTGRANPFAPVQ